MKSKGVIIQGSSRSNGNTNKIGTYIKDKTGFDIIDLKQNKLQVLTMVIKIRMMISCH